MDTIRFDKYLEELTVHSQSTKKNPLNLMGTKFNASELDNVFFYKARKRIYLYMSLILLIVQFLLGTFEMSLKFSSPFLIGMMLWAGMLIFFILYYAMPSFNLAIFGTGTVPYYIADISKGQMFEALNMTAAVDKYKTSAQTGRIIQTKKLLIAEKGASLYISGKCAIKNGSIYDSVTLTTEIRPTKNTIITNNSCFNPFPIISLALGVIIFLFIVLIVGSTFSSALNSPEILKAIEQNFGVVLMGTTLIVFFLGGILCFALLLITLGLCFISRTVTTAIKIHLSPNFIIRCKLRSKDRMQIEAMLFNIKTNIATKEEVRYSNTIN